MSFRVNVSDGGAGVRVEVCGRAEAALLDALLDAIRVALTDGHPIEVDLRELDGETATIERFVAQIKGAADCHGVSARVVPGSDEGATPPPTPPVRPDATR